MSNKTFFVWLAFLDIIAAIFFILAILFRFDHGIQKSFSAFLEIVPISVLIHLFIFLLAWEFYRRLLARVGKDVQERQLNIFRFGTLFSFVLIDAIFLRLIAHMGAGSGMLFAVQIPFSILVMFYIVFYLARKFGTK